MQGSSSCRGIRECSFRRNPHSRRGRRPGRIRQCAFRREPAQTPDCQPRCFRVCALSTTRTLWRLSSGPASGRASRARETVSLPSVWRRLARCRPADEMTCGLSICARRAAKRGRRFRNRAPSASNCSSSEPRNPSVLALDGYSGIVACAVREGRVQPPVRAGVVRGRYGALFFC
jgi:hypothetical protein